MSLMRLMLRGERTSGRYLLFPNSASTLPPRPSSIRQALASVGCQTSRLASSKSALKASGVLPDRVLHPAATASSVKKTTVSFQQITVLMIITPIEGFVSNRLFLKISDFPLASVRTFLNMPEVKMLRQNLDTISYSSIISTRYAMVHNLSNIH